MGAAVKGGLWLGISVVLFNAILYATGLWEPIGNGAILAYILLNIVFVILTLRRTKDSNGYGGQFLSSMVVGGIAALIIVVGGYVLLAMVFPGVTDEIAAQAMEQAESAGSTDEELDATAKFLEFLPLISSVVGGVAAFFTSLVVGAIAAVWLRRKD